MRATPKCWATNKVRYRDQIAAGFVLAELVRRDKEGHNERRSYQCHACRGWHLTSWDSGRRNWAKRKKKQKTRAKKQQQEVGS